MPSSLILRPSASVPHLSFLPSGTERIFTQSLPEGDWSRDRFRAALRNRLRAALRDRFRAALDTKE